MIAGVRQPHDPQRFEALFEDVWSEVLNLEAHLTVHHALFQDRTTGVRAAAPITFAVFGAALTSEILLAVHRLLEPGAQRGRRTASFETLLSHLPPEAAPMRRELQKTLAALRADCRALAVVRHRELAHRDLAVALAEESRQDPVRAGTLLGAMNGFARILTAISERCDLNLPYEPGKVGHDVDRLIARLTAPPQ